MKKKEQKKVKKIKIDPEDGTKIYMPLGQRFSVGEYLAQIAPPHGIEPTEDNSFQDQA